MEYCQVQHGFRFVQQTFLKSKHNNLSDEIRCIFYITFFQTFGRGHYFNDDKKAAPLLIVAAGISENYI